jgi:hypothetical protein
MRISKRVVVPVACLLAGVGVMTLHAQEDDLDPMKVAPDVQKIRFENAFVRVSEERMPAGRFVPRHRHHRGLVIAMADYQTEQTLDDGKKVMSNRKMGDINWQETFVHAVRNSGTTDQWAIRIELK